MRRFWRFSLIAAASLIGLCLFTHPIVGEAKVIEGHGTNATDAVIVDKKGTVYSHSAVLPEDLTYYVKYKLSIDNWLKIDPGDEMYFYVPANVRIPADDTFPMSAGLGLSFGQATIKQGSHVGVVVFNSAFSNTAILRVGYIRLYVKGAGDVDNPEAPGTEEPEPEEPGIEPGEPGTEEPGTEEPGTEEPGTEEPGTEEPGTEEPGTEEPGTEEPGTEEPGTEEPGTEEPGTEEPGTEEPGTEQPGTEYPEAPGVEEPGTEQPGTTEPGTEQPGTTTPTEPENPSEFPGDEQVPGVTYPGHPGQVTPGTSLPVIPGGSGSYVTGSTTGANTSTHRPTYTTQKPNTTTTMHQTEQPATSASQSSEPATASESGSGATGQVADQTNNSSATTEQPAKKLPQTNEQPHDGLVILGLSLLSFTLGLGYLDRRQRKEN
ncbi:LPXTG cell wall anchor domain-containing protein [Levilactobacillus yiduensis]|uniref:LPXTG cell wall anchor domain-containing protein n=1 Tax=Levilactobacillus yiduensis TaxID=2953880 RepID=UPI000EF33020|nr:LPXTG cell wall anchor domain-containing protein [Levilactobacillus yiduensis]AYM03693.1 LPXTG cell wall anchor domain-containing protein [Levilactobacillus brevis]